jgi:hypothetical protein
MPKRTKTSPPNFQSDSEDETRAFKAPASPSVLNVDDTPPAPKQQPGRLARVYTLPDDDNDKAVDVDPSSRSLGPPPMYKHKEEPPKAGIVDLVGILASSNANLKGKIDDSGRFELEFELVHTRDGPGDRRRRRPSEDSNESTDVGYRSREKGTKGSKPGNKRLLWI